MGIEVIIIVGVLVLVGGLVYVGLRRDRGVDPPQERLAQNNDRETPESLEEIELSLSLKDRILIPIIKKLSEITTRFTPQKQLERTHPNNIDGMDTTLSTPGDKPSTPVGDEEKRITGTVAPVQPSQEPAKPGEMTPNEDRRGIKENDKPADDDDEFMEEPEEEESDIPKRRRDATEEIPPLKPAIDDTQTMRAVSPKDTQEMQQQIQDVPMEMLPEEVTDWMDQLAAEKAKMDGDTMDYMEAEPIAGEAVLDIDYPEKDDAPKNQPTKPVSETTSDNAPSATTAHFSAFYPREAEAGNRYGVYIYAHAESMLEQITRDAAKFKEELGGTIPQPRIAKESKALEHGTQITIALESEEIEFEPDVLTKRWYGDWTRYEFEFRPDAELIDETIFVRASIMVMGFEIAKIKFAMEIIAPQMQVMSRSPLDAADTPGNPFAKAKLESKMAVKYEKIFISYSRKDKLIAEAFKVIQEAAGNDVFFDVDDIRTGEDWQSAIARAIDEADYLQLFWSEHSAKSEWCGYEWDYALTYRCQENKCREFIRPVWWTAPMPAPPESLRHLNFRRFDFEKLMKRD